MTRSVHRSEESLIEYGEEDDKLANTVTMTERDTSPQLTYGIRRRASDLDKLSL